MTSERRKFTDDQKLEILQLAEKIGVTAALRMHSLSYSVFTKWKQKYMNAGNLKPGNDSTHRSRTELKQLTEENARLKKIIAEQALVLERKDEELKRSNAMLGKSRQQQ